jgi:glycosyltransferase involved in cell wall biosynthesis
VIPLRFQGAINSWLGERYLGIMSRLAVARARRVIAVSETTRRDLMNLLRVNPAKIRTIGEGADRRFEERVAPERLQALRDRFRLGPRYLLYTGQWKPHKNLPMLLTAFAKLRRRHAELQLVLLGREDPKQPHVPALIRRLGLEDAVIRTGYLRDEGDIVGLFQGASVLAHPARYEGFGLPPLEAMAAGVPVVASNAASLPEVVGDAGLLVPPDDIAGWVAALERALLDQPLRERLIRAGLERSRRLTWDRAAAETLALYHEVLHETAPSRAPARLVSPWHLWDHTRTPRSSFES